MPIDVARARADTPGCENRIHFNNCGAALMPKTVIDAVKNHIDLEAAIGGDEAAETARASIDNVYASVARLLNCAPEETAIVENATRAWDMAFYAMTFRPGDRILTAVAEYASNYIPFLQVARKTGAIIEVVPNDDSGALDVDALEKMMDGRVKLIAVTHVPTNGGLVNPASEIGRVAKHHDVPFLLDACQSVGQIPVDVQAMGVDMLSATSRKYLRGPRGVGFLYVSKAWIEHLEPAFLDLHAATWVSPTHYKVRTDAKRFENWECNVAAKLGLGAAVDYALGWGMEAIYERVTVLSQLLRTQLHEISSVNVHDQGSHQCGIISFSADNLDSTGVVQCMKERGINLSVSNASSTRLDMDRRGLGAVARAGVHYYNTKNEIARFVQALADVCHMNV